MGWLIATFAIGVFVGWLWAHSTIASECEHLGSFFVGRKTFHCHRVDDRSQHPAPSIKETT
tara:strand:+ start:767 stop:949 length:183 start_codon:yes stop_codon:yes gene_type:complete